MRRTRSGCCALAVSGHAAAPPKMAMSSRRLTDHLMDLQEAVYQTLRHCGFRIATCACGPCLKGVNKSHPSRLINTAEIPLLSAVIAAVPYASRIPNQRCC